MSEKHDVRNAIIVALGILLIIDIAVLAYVAITDNRTITDRDNQIAALKTTGTILNNTIVNLTSKIMGLTWQVGNLTVKNKALSNIVDMNVSTILINDDSISQGASQSTPFTFSTQYAGYVSVTLLDFGPTRTDSAIIECSYYAYGLHYDSGKYWITIGESVLFPVLPTSSLTILVGNGYWFNGATETVTITYTY